MMNQISHFLALIVLVVLTCTKAVSAQSKQTDFIDLERAALEELKTTNTPGAVVAVISGDSVVFVKGFGISNAETSAPVTPDTLFRIGSITKMFTAAAFVTLSEEGKTRLDQPIGSYIKGLTTKLSQVSAHQLLSHTAGFNAELSWEGPHDETALADTLRSRNDDFFIVEPGRAFSYSNLGYAFAGFAVQEVSGKPYADYLNDRLFQPLGMTHTTLRTNLSMTYLISQGHNFDARTRTSVVVRPVVDNVIYWPAGYIWSSANDLARFAIAFLNKGKIEGKQVLSPTMIRKLSTPYAEIPDSITEGAIWKYGYGLAMYEYRGVRVVEHGGDVPGFGALFRTVPEHRFAVIVLANQSGSALNKTAEKAMELVLPLKAKAGNKSRPALLMSEGEIVGMIGTYVNADYKAEIFVKEGKPFFRAFGSELPIMKIGNDRFSASASNDSQAEEFVLVRGDDGKIKYLHYALRVFKKIR